MLVTGATRGLGASLTRQLLLSGANTIGIARDRSRLDTMDREVHVAGGRARLMVAEADVARPGAVSAALSVLGVAPADIDIVIVNAGVKLRADALIDVDAIRRTFETNVFGALETVNAVLPAMVERGTGVIVFISSLGRWHGMRAAQGYNASKAALSNLADSLRIDLTARGVRGVKILLIEPGLIRTDMVAAQGLRGALAVGADGTASRILNGIRTGDAYLSFPASMRVLTRILSALPSSLRASILSKT